MKGHKRNRSVQDTPLDLSKARAAVDHLDALQEELDGIQGMEGEMTTIMEHIRALQKILENAKKPCISFSSITKNDLSKVGLVRKRLIFDSEGVARLLERTEPALLEEIKFLHTQLCGIYEHVNMDESGARMILDAVLLSVAKMAPTRKSGHGIAIFPEMRLTTGDGINITHPTSGFEIWLTGTVDYGIIQYPMEYDNKEILLGDDNSREDVFTVAQGCLLLVEAKRQVKDGLGLASHMPEAVGQALALSEITKEKDVRFCLSNGRSWIFAMLQNDIDGHRIYYESTVRRLDKDILQDRTEDSQRHVHEIVELVFEWLEPTVLDGLYTLMN